MSESILIQGQSLVEGLLMGVTIGLLYDVLRVVRVRFGSALLGHMLDLFFWGTVTLGIFVWSQEAFGGTVRLYGVEAVAVGSILYFCTFTKVFLWICFLLADIIEFIFHVLYLPVTLLVWLEKKFKKFTQKVFLFLLKWYKIYGMTGALERAIGSCEKQEKGVVGNAFDPRRSTDENGRGHIHDLPCDHVAHRSWGSADNTVCTRPVTARRVCYGRRKPENVPRTGVQRRP